jgi:hypothetical protein
MIQSPVKTGESLGRVLVHYQGQTLTEVSAVSPIAFTAPTEQVGPGEAYNAVAPPAYNPNQENQ